jgi:hypothetical protein
MKITSSKLRTSHLTANEEALHRCEKALELKDKGDYESAREAMGQDLLKERSPIRQRSRKSVITDHQKD